jgi:outer membrane protein assembly factor BamB
MSIRPAIAAAISTVLVSLSVQAQPALLFRRGALVQQSRNALFVAKPGGRVEAVDLTSGRTLWSSGDAASPLGQDDAYVVAQIEQIPPDSRLRVVVLDAGDGRKISEASIDLPPDVRALVQDDLGESFRAVAEREGAVFVISWFYQFLPIEAVAERGEHEEPRLVAGTIRILADSGRVVGAAAAAVNAVPDRFRAFGSAPRPPWRAGNVSASVEGGRGDPLTLKRSNSVTGAVLPDRVLSKQAISSLASVDERNLLAAERVGEGGEDDPEYRWRIFNLETGDSIAEFRRDVSVAPFIVSRENVVFESAAHGFLSGGAVWVEEPLRIHAVRASTGSPVWSTTVRDLSYRGPMPPKR